MYEIVLAILYAFLLVVLAEGVGIYVQKKMGLHTGGYRFPFGIAVLFSVLEVFYLPILFFSLPATAASVMTILVLLASVVLTLYEIKDVFHSFVQRDSIGLVLSIALFVFVFQHSSDLSIGLAELNFAQQNAYAHQVSFLSPLQGYSLLQAVCLRYLSKEQLLLMLGCVYHFVFGALSLNILRTLKLRNQWLTFTLVVYALFYTGFNHWQIARSSAGSNWRVIFIALILWAIYCWLKEQKEMEKYTLLFYMTAGCFVSSGFAIISFEILYGLALYLFQIHKNRSLFDLTTLLLPYAIYYSIMLARDSIVPGILLLLAIVIFTWARYRKNLRRWIRRSEDFLFDHGKQILLLYIPIAVMAASVILSFLPWSLTVPYSFYSYFVTFEPTKSYLFLDYKVLTWILDVFRWLGLILLLWKGKRAEEMQLKNLFLIMVVLFLNPLSMGLVARFVGIDVYSYTFEILFNPFTDLILFVAIYHVFEWQTIGQWVLELFLIAACLIGHVGSFMGMEEGLYTDFVRETKVQEVTQ